MGASVLSNAGSPRILQAPDEKSAEPLSLGSADFDESGALHGKFGKLDTAEVRRGRTPETDRLLYRRRR